MHCLGKVEMMIACAVMGFFLKTLFNGAKISSGMGLGKDFSVSKQWRVSLGY